MDGRIYLCVRGKETEINGDLLQLVSLQVQESHSDLSSKCNKSEMDPDRVQTINYTRVIIMGIVPLLLLYFMCVGYASISMCQ